MPLTFVVYDPEMPSRVPHRLFLKRLILQLRNNLLTYLRFLLVCFIWLGLVPFLARWIWRFYFRFGDWSVIPTTPPANNSTTEETAVPVVMAETTGILEEGFFGWLRGQDIWTAILRDCFQGQIITICLVAVFVVVFLIREWVMQNAVAVVEEGARVVPPEPIPEGQREQPAENLDELWAAEREVFTEPEETNQQRNEDEDANAGPIQDDPFRYEHQWERQRTDYFVDPYARPVPQAQDVEAALARQAEQQQNILDPNPPQNVAPVQQPVPPPQNLAPLNFPANDFNIRRDFDDDDLDGDDFDGLWDILGMQGPIIGLLHNTVFSALMIALAVGLGVWLPFMFGKTALSALVRCPSECNLIISGTSGGCFSSTSIDDGSNVCGYLFRCSIILYRWSTCHYPWDYSSFPRYVERHRSQIIRIRRLYGQNQFFNNLSLTHSICRSKNSSSVQRIINNAI
jgi:hypothetical protein